MANNTGYRTSGNNDLWTGRGYVARQTGVLPFPMRYTGRLVYGVNVTLTTAGSVNTPAGYTFVLNSLYDPDYSGAGHQPYQYDLLTTVYSNYIVKSTYIDLTFSDPTADGLWVGSLVRSNTDAADSSPGKTLSDMLERPNFKVVPINDTGAQTATIRTLVPHHLVFGLSKSQFLSSLELYAAAYNASPSGASLLEVFLIDPTARSTPYSIRVTGRLVFDVEMYGYNAVASS